MRLEDLERPKCRSQSYSVAGFGADQVAGLDPNAVAGLSAQQMAAFDPNAVAGFDKDKVSALDPNAVGGSRQIKWRHSIRQRWPVSIRVRLLRLIQRQ